jgi:hypothetical protein
MKLQDNKNRLQIIKSILVLGFLFLLSISVYNSVLVQKINYLGIISNLVILVILFFSIHKINKITNN